MCCQGPRDYGRMWRQWTKVLRSKLLTWYTFPKGVKVVGWWHKNPQPLGEQNRLKMGRLLEAVPCHDPLRYHSSMVFQSLLLTKVIQFSRYIWLYLIFKSLQKSKIISRYRKQSSWRPTFLLSLMIFPSEILDLPQLLKGCHFFGAPVAEVFISTSRRICFHLEHRMTVQWVCPRSACECPNSLVKTAAGSENSVSWVNGWYP